MLSNCVTLGCGTAIDYADLENANLSFVPCGQVGGKDQPLLKYSQYWDKRVAVKRETYGKKWNGHTLKDMTGVQLMTGFPTYRRLGNQYYYYNSLDIERVFIERFPNHVKRITDIYKDNAIGTPCILKTKSNGLRLDVFTAYVGNKMSFKDADGSMLFEILANKCLARLDNRYHMQSGSILDMPMMPKTALQEIYHIINEVATEEQSDEKPRQVVGKSQIGDLEIHWDSNNRSQLFPTEYCQVSSHASNRDEVRFSKSQGGIDGKCFNCGGTWWEVKPTKKPPMNATEPPVTSGTPSDPQDNPLPDTPKISVPPLEIPENHDGQIIPFPVEALEDTIFGVYEQAYQGTNETCPAFRFAELATAIGARLGRSVCYRPPNAPHIDETQINDPDFLAWFAENLYMVYPNFYSCLWGEPSESKKSTSIRKARKLKIWDDDMLILDSLSTREGFVSLLVASEDQSGKPPRALILYDELAGLFSKARQQNSESLISMLNTAYYGERLDSNTKEEVKQAKTNGKIGGETVEDVSVSFIGGITPYWLQGKMTMEEIGSGFASRFMYFQHEQQELRPEPLPADPYFVYEVYTKLNKIDANTPTRYFQLDAEAREVYSDWYVQNGENKPKNPVVKLARQRLQEYAIKTALQVAYFKSDTPNHATITLDDFSAGMALADYWGKVIQSIFSEFTDNERTARVRKVVAVLQKLGGVNVKRGDILGSIGGRRMTPDELTTILNGLVENEYILISGQRPQVINVINPALFDI